MVHFVLAAVLVLNSGLSLAEEQLPMPTTPAPAEEEATARGLAEARGLAAYRHDEAAALATDAAFKLKSFRKDKRVRGWITQEQREGILVTFLDQSPSALYRVLISTEGVAGPVTALKTPEMLSEYERGAATARNAALGAEFQSCSDSYNTVVLPNDKDEDSWIVYLIPGSTTKDRVPLGGTYRMEVSGGQVVAQRSFTRSCIVLPNHPDAVALVITHSLDPIPTEAHVYWSLWVGKPFFVRTSGGMWRVDSRGISELEPTPQSE